MKEPGNNGEPSILDKISKTAKTSYEKSVFFLKKSWQKAKDDFYPKAASATKKGYDTSKFYTKKSYQTGKRYTIKGYQTSKHYTKEGYQASKHYSKKGWASFKTFLQHLSAKTAVFLSAAGKKLKQWGRSFSQSVQKIAKRAAVALAALGAALKVKWANLRQKWQDREAKKAASSAGNKSGENTTQASLFERVTFSLNVTYNVSKNLMLILFVFLVIGGAFVGGAGLGFFASLVSGEEPPTYEEMEVAIGNLEQTSTMYYAGGETISDFRSDLKRTNVPLSDISQHVIDGLIATEDEYFWEHEGVVPKAVLRAAIQQLIGASETSGGSTITQQLVKQQILSSEVTFERKANEILIALRLENYFSKEEILEAYLNVSPFGRNSLGQNIAGVQEAATGIFGVDASELTIPQAAFVAGLPQNPITYSPYTNAGEIKEDQSAGMDRKNEVLLRMFREGYITEDEYTSAREYDLTQDFITRQDSEQNTNSFAYDAIEKEALNIVMENLYTTDGYTKEEIDANQELYTQYQERANDDLRFNGYKVYSTLDKAIHQDFKQIASEHGPNLGQTKPAPPVYDAESESYVQPMEEDPETGEMVPQMVEIQVGSSLIDNATGRIIAFVGGTNYMENMLNHGLDVERQPGSTIKPLLVYAPGFEAGLITPASMVSDSRLFVPSGGSGSHEITNVGQVYSGENVPVRQALSESMNIPTTRIYMELLEQTSPAEYLPAMGLGPDVIHPDEYNNPSLALGGTGYSEQNEDGTYDWWFGPTVLEMTSAFSTLGNNGKHAEPFLIDRIETRNGEVLYQNESTATEVFSPEASYLTVDILREVMETTARGTEEQLNFSADIAGKTGTTDAREDVWFIGMTPNVTLSSWMGYDVDKISLSDENGQSPSTRNRGFWARLMNAVHENNPTLVGTDKTFVQPEGIVTENVLAETGMKSGTVTVPEGAPEAAQQSAEQFAQFEERRNSTSMSSWVKEGTEIPISGETKQEIFAKDKVPGETTYDFLIGGPAYVQNSFWKAKAQSEEGTEAEEEENEE